jgi:hypothetical protein
MCSASIMLWEVGPALNWGMRPESMHSVLSTCRGIVVHRAPAGSCPASQVYRRAYSTASCVLGHTRLWPVPCRGNWEVLALVGSVLVVGTAAWYLFGTTDRLELRYF